MTTGARIFDCHWNLMASSVQTQNSAFCKDHHVPTPFEVYKVVFTMQGTWYSLNKAFTNVYGHAFRIMT